jgi:glycosyltransferase involved in cell wall biosynthesis
MGSPSSYVVSRITYMLGAARLIKHGGYDIVIEDVSPFSPVGAPLWKRRVGVPAIASVQNLPGRHATAKYGVPGLAPRLVERPLLRLFQHFVAVSPGIAEAIRQSVSGVRVEVIPNSSDLQALASISSEPESAGAAPGYVLFLGRVDVYQKGLDRLLEAFDLLADGLPGTRLLIAGGGVERQMAELNAVVDRARHRDRVEVVGQVDRAEAAGLLKGAALLAMPSRYEAWPLTAVEAAAAGTPVVGFDIVGVRDAAPAYPDGPGVHAPEGDTRALAENMRRVVVDESFRSELRALGKAWARRFSWDALATRQLAFYYDTIHHA